MWILYCIENKINGKLYIGKTNDYKRRIQRHKHNSENQPLNRAIKKYGTSNFYFQEFQYFSSEEECYEMERYWIQYLKDQNINLYNIAEGGNRIFSGSNHYLFGKHHTDESKKKMSISHTGMKHSPETIQKLSDANKGMVVSQETRDKISISKVGKPLSDEHKTKISKTSMGRIHSEETKKTISEHNTGENNPSSKLTDDEVKTILTLWFSIDPETRNEKGYKITFYNQYIRNIFYIKPITLYEYLRGKKRKNIYELFQFT